MPSTEPQSLIEVLAQRARTRSEEPAAVVRATRATLAALAPDERQAAIVAYLAVRATEAARLPPGRLGLGSPLVGLDSLSALELKSTVEDELGVALPVSLLLEGETLERLAAETLALWAGTEEATEEPLRPAASPPAEFPLSPGQRALWFLDRLAPSSAAYHVAAAARIARGLDAAALRRACQALVDRHPVLRTTFESRRGEPVQRVRERMEIDFSLLPAADASASALSDLLHAEAFRPFDLERGPLVRLRVLERAGEERVVLFSLHHLVTDFASLALLLRELSARYREAVGGAPPAPGELAAPAISYADYVDWQHRRLAGAAGERLWSYWRERLAGPLPDLDLPTDRPRPAVMTHRGGTSSLRLDLLAPLKALGQRRGTTLYAVLLAAFQALLHRYTGQVDVPVGSPVSGRTHAALAELPGYLVNAVVLRGDLEGAPPFAAHLERTGRDVRDALTHQDFPFPLLAERLRPLRDPGCSPLFQVLFTLQRSHLPGTEALAALALGEDGVEAELGGLSLTPLPLERRPAQLDLVLEAAEVGGKLVAVLGYNADLFDGATARRMLGHLAVLLAAAAERPETPVGDLPLLAAAERRQLLVEWNATTSPFPRDLGVHQVFEERARRRPETVALEMEGRWLSYGELDRRADRLAHRLRRAGVGPDVPVALHLDRSPEMVVALLGVLKAGGAYLPLDPSYPEERLAFMLEDSGVRVLLTAESLSPPSLFAGTVLRLPGEGPETGVENGVPAISAPVAPDGLAYLIYTSGSTGKPKGVLVRHAGVVNFLTAMGREPGLAAGDVLLSVTTLSFDIAALEIFLPLSVGARLALVSRETAGDGAALSAALERCGATALQATPATWRLLRAAGWEGRPGLALLCGGEALPRELAAELLPRGAALWNLYGPTETTIWSAAGRVAPGEGPVPLGPPIANTAIHLLDRALQPVPVGVPGELWIGGVGLARGYHRRPELTAERFVPDPWGEAGARLYRTGDVARRRADGRIDFLGRVDHQVKVRGHRIELGEIETCLARHPSVREAVVLAREDRPGDRRLVAYVLPAADAPASADLRAHLRAHLPEPMVPGSFVFLTAWPLTLNGKIDRKALPAPAQADTAASPSTGHLPPRPGLERTIAAIWQEVLGVPRVGLADNFFDLGGHSLLLARVQARLKEELPGAEPSMVDLLRHPTVGALAAFLGEPGRLPARRSRPRRAATPGERTDIAVIAMAGRFPGAADVERLWQNLRHGVESIVPLSTDELRAAGVAPELLADPAYVKAAAALDGVESFDAPFFGYNPREAETLDPQHRLFLECAWEALELAGYDPERYLGAVGVYAGVGLNAYLLNNLRGNREFLDAVGSYQAFISNDKDFVPTRVSYKLNLRGPSVNVQTACSSSLVAVHLARQALLLGECDMALAGGVSIAVPHRVGYLYQAGGIPSPDGHCRAFDARAKGTVRGNGVGIVVLKRLEDALADGDSVRAVIRGSAINNDGSGKVGYTAPSVDGQAEVIAAALEAAGVSPETVGYVEAHGTGTELGDPIEVAALTQAYRAAGATRRGFCALGSVKTNLGHLDTAAGVAGLIKAVLAVERGELPPSLHFEEANPNIDFAASPFRVNAGLAHWQGEAGAPRRAGVSSFGIGGTNAHLVLEEAPQAAPSGAARPADLFLLSARSAAALETATGNLATYLADNPGLTPAELADVAYTLQVGRKTFAHRRMAVCRGYQDALAVLAGRDPERLLDGVVESGAAGDPPVAFLFPGQGAQHPGMGADLYRGEPLFRAQVDEGAERLRTHLGFDLREVLYPRPEETEEAARRLDRTGVTQPALFVVEHALARLWMSWGVRPQALLGHSVGELVAACLAGVFSFADALDLVAARGRLMEALPGGAMLAVPLPEADLVPLLATDLALAAVNGPAACTASGRAEAIEELARRLAERGVEARRLHVSHAFHSALMDPAVDAFVERVRRVERRTPRLSFLSNVTGTWITPAEATDPAYWGRHLRATVRFAAGVAELSRDPGRVLLEVGPGQTLTTVVRQPSRTAIPSMRHPQAPRPDLDLLLEALGKLWMAGVPVDWDGFHAGERRRRLPLPTYPFERQRYWVEPAAGQEASPLRRAPGIDGWLYAPLWRETVPPELPPAPERGLWLLLADRSGLAARLAAHLAERGHEVVTVEEPLDRASHEACLARLDRAPDHVVHARAIDPLASSEEGVRLFDSLLLLAQAAGRRGWSAPQRWTVLSSGLHRLPGESANDPGKALVLGPCRVLAQEYPHLACRSVDVSPGDLGELDDLAERLVAELEAGSAATPAPPVAWRGEGRWEQTYEPLRLAAPAEDGPVPHLRDGGVYLVTGGLGGLGLTFAELLVRRARARLVLVGRRADRSLAAEQVARLEALGAEVLVAPGDVTDPESMAAVVAQARRRFGTIHGVIHAAGVPGGGLVQVKSPEAAARVLAPKVRGTLVLERALAGEPLDFFLLCSSITGVLGGFGQVDYCAANAFLDAFARSRATRRGTFYAAIDWDRWREVGMAAAPAPTAPLHPLLDRCLTATPERAVYATRLAVPERWILSEHLILGRATVPGTAYLEMARAALEQVEGGGPVEIREAVFLTPLVVGEGERADVLTVLEREGEGYRFQVSSAAAGSTREHARGRVGRPAGTTAAPRRFDIGEILARCADDLGSAGLAHARGLSGFLETGPRWRNLTAMRGGVGESFATLELAPGFADDLSAHALHPALLDVAAGSVQLRAAGNYLPLAYESLRFHASLPARIYSHARYRGESGDTLTCDISILDPAGEELVAITGFSMKRVGEEAAAQIRALAGKSEGDRRDGAAADSRFAALVSGRYGVQGGGIAPSDGAEVLCRVLGGRLPQVVVSTVDLETARAEAAAWTGARIAEELAALSAPHPAQARPAVQTRYIAPGSDLEQKIAAVWQRVLGIEQIGIHDNFFELGGTSLSGVQLVAELKKALDMEIPSVSIFEAPTVAALARHLAPPADGPAFAAARERAQKKQEVLERQRELLSQSRRRGARVGV